MSANWFFGCLFARLQEFRNATAANVTVTFALALVPMLGAAGAAVDYSNASSIRTAMQDAADATALMLAKLIGSSGTSLTNSQINQKANDYFAALLNRPEAKAIQVNATYSTDKASQVVVSATSSMQTNFMGLLGFPTLNIGVTAQTTWGGAGKMQVALVLDNTGSMAEYYKMPSLKTATLALLNQLQASAAHPNDIQVAIVPFAEDVNVGASNYNASWIDWTDWDAANGKDTSTTTCTTVPGKKKGKPASSCSTSTTWVPANHNTWNGCVTDRDQDYDVSNAKPNPSDKNLPASAASSLFPADQSWACPVPMIALTNNWTSLAATVNSMTPNGFTNQAIGLAWGWQALTNGPPTNAPGKSPDTQRVIILLTDGLNTADRWYNDQASIDARQKTLCSNIKADDITIYTIQVDIGRMDPVSTLLQGCASKPEYSYLLTTAGEIATVFNTIGKSMSKLRIAR